MTIIINGKETLLPAHIKTLKDLTELNSIPEGGTAIALNSNLVKAPEWSSTILAEGDNLMIISAAYGG